MLKGLFSKSPSKAPDSPGSEPGGIPLFEAIRANDLKDVKKHLEKTSALNADRAGRNALHIAAEVGNLDVFKAVIKSISKGQLTAALNTPDRLGSTPLFVSVVNGNRKVAAELLKLGADASMVNAAKESILHAPFQAPFMKKAHAKVMQLVLPQKGVDVNALDGKDRTPLQLACGKGAFDCAMLLLKAHANATLIKGGEPPLFAACVAENPALVKALLEHGADISQVNSSGQTLMELLNPKCDIYKIIKRHLIDRPGGARKLGLFAEECIVATSLEDLPMEVVQVIARSELKSAEIQTNWAAFCDIVHVVLKKKIVATPEEAVQQRDKLKTKVSSENDLAEIEIKRTQLLTPGDPRMVFKKMRVAGRGGFGMVFQGVGPDKKTWAIKRMPHTSDKEKLANLREAVFLKDCHHRNICSYKATYECTADHEMWLIMDLLEGGTLDESIGNASQEASKIFNEKHLAYIAGEMLQGLEYLHLNHIVHRDLKSQNVMFTTTGEVKLIDLGSAISVADPSVVHKDITGSPYWMAPEVILRRGHGPPCDIWSMAVCIQQLANHHPPTGSIIRHLFLVATGVRPTLDHPEKWSERMTSFLELCLLFEPEKRPTAPVLRRHKWVTQGACSQTDMALTLREMFFSRDFKGGM